MAELGNENPAVNPSQDGSQEVGERMGFFERQLSELATLVSSQQDLLNSLVEMQQGKEVESSGSERVAPRDTGLEAGAHQSGATGGAAGSMGGDAQGFGVSSMPVGSRSVSSGLNPHVSAGINTSVPAVNFGSIHGTVGRAAVGSQSAVPPAPSMSSEWWEMSPVETHCFLGLTLLTPERSWVRVVLKFPKLLFLTAATCRTAHGRRTFC